MDLNVEQIKPVVKWIKGHLLIALMSILIVAFPVCGWYFSTGMAAELKDDRGPQEELPEDRAGRQEPGLPADDRWTVRGDRGAEQAAAGQHAVAD